MTAKVRKLQARLQQTKPRDLSRMVNVPTLRERLDQIDQAVAFAARIVGADKANADGAIEIDGIDAERLHRCVAEIDAHCFWIRQRLDDETLDEDIPDDDTVALIEALQGKGEAS